MAYETGSKHPLDADEDPGSARECVTIHMTSEYMVWSDMTFPVMDFLGEEQMEKLIGKRVRREARVFQEFIGWPRSVYGQPTPGVDDWVHSLTHYRPYATGETLNDVAGRSAEQPRLATAPLAHFLWGEDKPADRRMWFFETWRRLGDRLAAVHPMQERLRALDCTMRRTEVAAPWRLEEKSVEWCLLQDLIATAFRRLPHRPDTGEIHRVIPFAVESRLYSAYRTPTSTAPAAKAYEKDGYMEPLAHIGGVAIVKYARTRLDTVDVETADVFFSGYVATETGTYFFSSSEFTRMGTGPVLSPRRQALRKLLGYISNLPPRSWDNEYKVKIDEHMWAAESLITEEEILAAPEADRLDVLERALSADITENDTTFVCDVFDVETRQSARGFMTIDLCGAERAMHFSIGITLEAQEGPAAKRREGHRLCSLATVVDTSYRAGRIDPNSDLFDVRREQDPMRESLGHMLLLRDEDFQDDVLSPIDPDKDRVLDFMELVFANLLGADKLEAVLGPRTAAYQTDDVRDMWASLGAGVHDISQSMDWRRYARSLLYRLVYDVHPPCLEDYRPSHIIPPIPFVFQKTPRFHVKGGTSEIVDVTWGGLLYIHFDYYRAYSETRTHCQFAFTGYVILSLKNEEALVLRALSDVPSSTPMMTPNGLFLDPEEGGIASRLTVTLYPVENTSRPVGCLYGSWQMCESWYTLREPREDPDTQYEMKVLGGTRLHIVLENPDALRLVGAKREREPVAAPSEPAKHARAEPASRHGAASGAYAFALSRQTSDVPAALATAIRDLMPADRRERFRTAEAPADRWVRRLREIVDGDGSMRLTTGFLAQSLLFTGPPPRFWRLFHRLAVHLTEAVTPPSARARILDALLAAGGLEGTPAVVQSEPELPAPAPAPGAAETAPHDMFGHGLEAVLLKALHRAVRLDPIEKAVQDGVKGMCLPMPFFWEFARAPYNVLRTDATPPLQGLRGVAVFGLLYLYHRDLPKKLRGQPVATPVVAAFAGYLRLEWDGRERYLLARGEAAQLDLRRAPVLLDAQLFELGAPAACGALSLSLNSTIFNEGALGSLCFRLELFEGAPALTIAHMTQPLQSARAVQAELGREYPEDRLLHLLEEALTTDQMIEYRVVTAEDARTRLRPDLRRSLAELYHAMNCWDFQPRTVLRAFDTSTTTVAAFLDEVAQEAFVRGRLRGLLAPSTARGPAGPAFSFFLSLAEGALPAPDAPTASLYDRMYARGRSGHPVVVPRYRAGEELLTLWLRAGLPGPHFFARHAPEGATLQQVVPLPFKLREDLDAHGNHRTDLMALRSSPARLLDLEWGGVLYLCKYRQTGGARGPAEERGLLHYAFDSAVLLTVQAAADAPARRCVLRAVSEWVDAPAPGRLIRSMCQSGAADEMKFTDVTNPFSVRLYSCLRPGESVGQMSGSWAWAYYGPVLVTATLTLDHESLLRELGDERDPVPPALHPVPDDRRLVAGKRAREDDDRRAPRPKLSDSCVSVFAHAALPIAHPSADGDDLDYALALAMREHAGLVDYPFAFRTDRARGRGTHLFDLLPGRAHLPQALAAVRSFSALIAGDKERGGEPRPRLLRRLRTFDLQKDPALADVVNRHNLDPVLRLLLHCLRAGMAHLGRDMLPVAVDTVDAHPLVLHRSAIPWATHVSSPGSALLGAHGLNLLGVVFHAEGGAGEHAVYLAAFLEVVTEHRSHLLFAQSQTFDVYRERGDGDGAALSLLHCVLDVRDTEYAHLHLGSLVLVLNVDGPRPVRGGVSLTLNLDEAAATDSEVELFARLGLAGAASHLRTRPAQGAPAVDVSCYLLSLDLPLPPFDAGREAVRVVNGHLRELTGRADDAFAPGRAPSALAFLDTEPGAVRAFMEDLVGHATYLRELDHLLTPAPPAGGALRRWRDAMARDGSWGRADDLDADLGDALLRHRLAHADPGERAHRDAVAVPFRLNTARVAAARLEQHVGTGDADDAATLRLDWGGVAYTAPGGLHVHFDSHVHLVTAAGTAHLLRAVSRRNDPVDLTYNAYHLDLHPLDPGRKGVGYMVVHHRRGSRFLEAEGVFVTLSLDYAKLDEDAARAPLAGLRLTGGKNPREAEDDEAGPSAKKTRPAGGVPRTRFFEVSVRAASNRSRTVLAEPFHAALKEAVESAPATVPVRLYDADSRWGRIPYPVLCLMAPDQDPDEREDALLEQLAGAASLLPADWEITRRLDRYAADAALREKVLVGAPAAIPDTDRALFLVYDRLRDLLPRVSADRLTRLGDSPEVVVLPFALDTRDFYTAYAERATYPPPAPGDARIVLCGAMAVGVSRNGVLALRKAYMLSGVVLFDIGTGTRGFEFESRHPHWVSDIAEESSTMSSDLGGTALFPLFLRDPQTRAERGVLTLVIDGYNVHAPMTSGHRVRARMALNLYASDPCYVYEFVQQEDDAHPGAEIGSASDRWAVTGKVTEETTMLQPPPSGHSLVTAVLNSSLRRLGTLLRVDATEAFFEELFMKAMLMGAADAFLTDPDDSSRQRRSGHYYPLRAAHDRMKRYADSLRAPVTGGVDLENVGAAFQDYFLRSGLATLRTVLPAPIEACVPVPFRVNRLDARVGRMVTERDYNVDGAADTAWDWGGVAYVFVYRSPLNDVSAGCYFDSVVVLETSQPSTHLLRARSVFHRDQAAAAPRDVHTPLDSTHYLALSTVADDELVGHMAVYGMTAKSLETDVETLRMPPGLAMTLVADMNQIFMDDDDGPGAPAPPDARRPDPWVPDDPATVQAQPAMALVRWHSTFGTFPGAFRMPSMDVEPQTFTDARRRRFDIVEGDGLEAYKHFGLSPIAERLSPTYVSIDESEQFAFDTRRLLRLWELFCRPKPPFHGRADDAALPPERDEPEITLERLDAVQADLAQSLLFQLARADLDALEPPEDSRIIPLPFVRVTDQDYPVRWSTPAADGWSVDARTHFGGLALLRTAPRSPIRCFVSGLLELWERSADGGLRSNRYRIRSRDWTVFQGTDGRLALHDLDLLPPSPHPSHAPLGRVVVRDLAAPARKSLVEVALWDRLPPHTTIRVEARTHVQPDGPDGKRALWGLDTASQAWLWEALPAASAAELGLDTVVDDRGRRAPDPVLSLARVATQRHRHWRWLDPRPDAVLKFFDGAASLLRNDPLGPRLRPSQHRTARAQGLIEDLLALGFAPPANAERPIVPVLFRALAHDAAKTFDSEFDWGGVAYVSNVRMMMEGSVPDYRFVVLVVLEGRLYLARSRDIPRPLPLEFDERQIFVQMVLHRGEDLRAVGTLNLLLDVMEHEPESAVSTATVYLADAPDASARLVGAPSRKRARTSHAVPEFALGGSVFHHGRRLVGWHWGIEVEPIFIPEPWEAFLADVSPHRALSLDVSVLLDGSDAASAVRDFLFNADPDDDFLRDRLRGTLTTLGEVADGDPSPNWLSDPKSPERVFWMSCLRDMLDRAGLDTDRYQYLLVPTWLAAWEPRDCYVSALLRRDRARGTVDAYVTGFLDRLLPDGELAALRVRSRAFDRLPTDMSSAVLVLDVLDVRHPEPLGLATVCYKVVHPDEEAIVEDEEGGPTNRSGHTMLELHLDRDRWRARDQTTLPADRCYRAVVVQTDEVYRAGLNLPAPGTVYHRRILDGITVEQARRYRLMLYSDRETVSPDLHATYYDLVQDDDDARRAWKLLLDPLELEGAEVLDFYERVLLEALGLGVLPALVAREGVLRPPLRELLADLDRGTSASLGSLSGEWDLAGALLSNHLSRGAPVPDGPGHVRAVLPLPFVFSSASTRVVAPTGSAVTVEWGGVVYVSSLFARPFPPAPETAATERLGVLFDGFVLLRTQEHGATVFLARSRAVEHAHPSQRLYGTAYAGGYLKFVLDLCLPQEPDRPAGYLSGAWDLRNEDRVETALLTVVLDAALAHPQPAARLVGGPAGRDAPPPETRPFPFVGTTVAGQGGVLPMATTESRHMPWVEGVVANVLGPTAPAPRRLPAVHRCLETFANFIAQNPDLNLLPVYFGGVHPGTELPQYDEESAVEFFFTVAPLLANALGDLPFPTDDGEEFDADWTEISPAGGLARQVFADALRYGRDRVFTETFPETSADVPVYVVPFVFRHGVLITSDRTGAASGVPRGNWFETPQGSAARFAHNFRWGGVAFIHNPRALGQDDPNLYLHVVGYLTTADNEIFWLQTVEPAVLDTENGPVRQILVHAAVCDARDRTVVLGQFSAYLSGVVRHPTRPHEVNSRQYTLDLVQWRPSRAAAKRPRQEPALALVSHVFRTVPDTYSFSALYMTEGNPIADLVADVLPPALASVYRMVLAPDEVTGRMRPSLEHTARAVLEAARLPAEQRAFHAFNWPSFRGSPLDSLSHEIRHIDPTETVVSSSRAYANFLRFLDIDIDRLDVFFDRVALMLLGEGRTDDIAIAGSDAERKVRRLAEPIGTRDADVGPEYPELGRALLARLVADGPDRSGFPFRLFPGAHLLQVVPLPFVFRSDDAPPPSPGATPEEPAAPAAWQWGGVVYLGDVEASTGRQLIAVFDGFAVVETSDGSRLFRAVSDDEILQQFLTQYWSLSHFRLRLRSLMEGDGRRGLAVGTWGYPLPNSPEPTVALVSLMVEDA